MHSCTVHHRDWKKVDVLLHVNTKRVVRRDGPWVDEIDSTAQIMFSLQYLSRLHRVSAHQPRTNLYFLKQDN
jgi:hypothetical protein